MIKPAVMLAKICEECGDQFVSCWTRKIFCDGCGVARRARASGSGVIATKRAMSPALAEIEMMASERKTSLIRAFEAPAFEWVVAFKVKYSLDASKNRRWSNNGKGVVFLTQSVRKYQDYLIAATRRAMQGTPVVQNKVWVSFHVQKPNHKSDAINVVDTLCDAIKVAVGIDDRWFSIGRLDWEIRREDPEIFITIAQESRDEVIVCAHCGELKGLDQFSLNKSKPMGRSPVCRDCNSIIAKHRKGLRPAL